MLLNSSSRSGRLHLPTQPKRRSSSQRSVHQQYRSQERHMMMMFSSAIKPGLVQTLGKETTRVVSQTICQRSPGSPLQAPIRRPSSTRRRTTGQDRSFYARPLHAPARGADGSLSYDFAWHSNHVSCRPLRIAIVARMVWVPEEIGENKKLGWQL